LFEELKGFVGMSDDNDSPAAQAKAKGSDAWSKGDYQGSITHFTSAIELSISSNVASSNSKDFLKVLYSNRSAAYLKLNKVTEALKDSNKCIEIDSTWSKGYARKGDALLSSKKYTEAYNAYNAGLRISPNDSTLTEKSEQAMRAIRNASNSNTSSSSSYTSSSSTPSSGRSNTLSASASLVIPELYVKYIQMAIFYLGLIYCIPFIPIKYNYLSYR
jgi:stress-induced-phosphoprotein 1